MFGWFKKKKKDLSGMTVTEVMETIHATFPQIIQPGVYEPPTHRCSRWMLLRGPYYGDRGYLCSILVDASKMFDWLEHHAGACGTTVVKEEAAKNFLPDWVKNADLSDDTVTILDPHMRNVIKEYDLDFINKGWSKIWCPTCSAFSTSFVDNEHNRQKTGRMSSSWTSEWLCDHGHILQHNDQHIRFF